MRVEPLLSLSSPLLFFLAPLFPFSSCFSPLPLPLYLLPYLYKCTYTHAYRYTYILDDRAMKKLTCSQFRHVMPARGCKKLQARAAEVREGKGCKREQRVRKRGKRVEARRKRRLGRLNPPSRKNSDRGEIVLGSLEILTPFPSCCFFLQLVCLVF